MTPLQKNILNAVKRRPMTLRELQNNLQVDNSRLRTSVSAMVATGELSMRNGTYVPGFATYENAANPSTIPCTLVKLAARFGFASRDDGQGDIFIPGRALHGAMPQDKIDEHRQRALNPEHPHQAGTAQNPDIFFQEREVANQFYDTLPRVVEEYMNKINAMIGSDYHLFDYYGAPDAEQVIVAMGSVCQTIEEVIDHKLARGEKVGLIKVRLYRPFSREHLLRALPDTVKSITVLDRTKEPGSIGEPLYLDVVAALQGSRFQNVPVYTGRYGLGSKDVTPGQIFAVYRNAKTGQKPRFTIGITDDVTYLSLLETDAPDTTPNSTYCCKFWGLGSDGTVGANKNSIKIIGDHTNLYAQGFFSYDSKKSGGLTVSHLRFGREPIKSTYLVTKADFVACHNPAYLGKYDMVHDIKPGGIFLLNCGWSLEELESRFTGEGKSYLAKNNIRVFTIDANAIGKELGLGGRVNTVLQAAFFRLTGIIPGEEALRLMKNAATRAYGAKGDDIVAMNHAAIERGFHDAKEFSIPAHWAEQRGDFVSFYATGRDPEVVEYVNRIQIPADLQKGDDLPVSTFLGREDGHLPLGTSQYEKRGIAPEVPTWLPENCIQCIFSRTSVSRTRSSTRPPGGVNLNALERRLFMIWLTRRESPLRDKSLSRLISIRKSIFFSAAWEPAIAVS